MLIVAILVFGILAGGLAQLVLGRGWNSIDWGMACVAGIVGSFVGGLIVSLIAGDGIELRASGLIGSVAGAVIVTALWEWMRGRRTAAD